MRFCVHYKLLGNIETYYCQKGFNTLINNIIMFPRSSRRSFSMMVKWANDGLLQANDGKMLVNDGEILVNDAYEYHHH